MRKHMLAILTVILLIPSTVVARNNDAAPTAYNEFTVTQLQAEMADGRLTSVKLTQFYLDRISALDQSGPNVNSVIELNPDALQLAQSSDKRRAKGKTLGPLDGIPVLLKDNIDTGDKMQTTAGSFALAGKPATQDSTVAANLRAAGAVILGKTNLSEWANFRSFFSTSGWSGRGGLTHNPYSTDRNACGSSSGSGAAAAANFAAISVGTETDGSIVCPANVNAVVGIKPTVGLASPAGIVPISHTPDTPGRRPRQGQVHLRPGRRRVPRPRLRLQDRPAEVLRNAHGRSDGEQDARRRDRVQQRERVHRDAVLLPGDLPAR